MTLSAQPRGRTTCRPLSFTTTFGGMVDGEVERGPREPLELPALERAGVERLAGAPCPARTSMKVGPRTARTESVTRRCAAFAPEVAATRDGVRVDPLDLGVVVAAEAPRGDHERRDEEDRRERDPDGARLASLAPLSAARVGERGGGAGLPPPRRDVARVVLVDVEPAVEAERVRVERRKPLV